MYTFEGKIKNTERKWRDREEKKPSLGIKEMVLDTSFQGFFCSLLWKRQKIKVH